MTAGGVRPSPIALDDLVEPRFDDAPRSVLDLSSGAGSAVTLDPFVPEDQARAQTGLDDFGPDGYPSRLDSLCRALPEEARLNDAGVLTQSRFLTGPDPGPAESKSQDPGRGSHRPDHHLRPASQRNHPPPQSALR
jgi:hypothetical protein